MPCAREVNKEVNKDVSENVDEEPGFIQIDVASGEIYFAADIPLVYARQCLRTDP